jgi:hypothetical protein
MVETFAAGRAFRLRGIRCRRGFVLPAGRASIATGHLLRWLCEPETPVRRVVLKGAQLECEAQTGSAVKAVFSMERFCPINSMAPALAIVWLAIVIDGGGVVLKRTRLGPRWRECEFSPTGPSRVELNHERVAQEKSASANQPERQSACHPEALEPDGPQATAGGTTKNPGRRPQPGGDSWGCRRH